MYDRILVPLDGSKLAECVIPHVVKIAVDNNAKDVVLLRVCQPVSVLADYPSDMIETWDEHLKEIEEFTAKQCNEYLHGVKERLMLEGLNNVRAVNRSGKPALEILNYIDKNEIDLVIISSHGHTGAHRWAFGSVADKIVGNSPVPVLLVRGPECVPALE